MMEIGKLLAPVEKLFALLLKYSYKPKKPTE